MIGYVVSEAKYRAYDARFKDGVFYFTVRKDLLDYLLSLKPLPESITNVLKIRQAQDGNCVTFIIGSGTRKPSQETLHFWAQEISLLLEVLKTVQMRVTDGSAPSSILFEGKKPFLMLATGVNVGVIHAHPLVVGVSPRGRQKIRETYPTGTYLDGCSEVILQTFQQYIPASKKDRKMRKACHRSHIRICGTPGFDVPGDCACLGNNPDDFKDSGDLFSHNVDTAPQQLAMIAGVLTFNELLFP